MKIIGLIFLLIGVGLLGSAVLFNSGMDIEQVFFRGIAGIASCILGGCISIDSLKSSR